MVKAPGRVRGPGWPLLSAAVAALALCSAIGWLLLDQRAVLTQALSGLERFRQARLDLANGMLHHALAGGPELPYDRAQGVALLHQGIAEIQESIEADDGRGLEGALELRGSFQSSAQRFLGELADFPAAGGRDAAAQARLRMAFHELDRAADQFDRHRGAGLRTMVEHLDRNLVVTASAAAGLLLAIAIASLLVLRSGVLSLAALRASEDRLRTVLDNLVEGVVIADAGGRYLSWNHSAAELLGFPGGGPSDPSVLREMFEVLDADGVALPAESWPVARLARGELVHQMELSIRRRADGHERVLVCSGAIATDTAGDRLVCVSFSDITDRRRAERQLRAERDRFDRLARTAPGVVHSFRLATDGAVSFPYVSPQIQELYGVPPEELQRDGGAVFAGIHEEDRPAIWASIDDSRRQRTPWRAEFRFRHPVRGEIWIEGHSMPVDDGDGAVVWHGSLTEITERKRIEAVVRAQDGLLQEMGRIAKVGGWEFDPSTGRGQWTSEVARIHDLDPGAPPTYELGLQFYLGEARQQIEAAVAAAIADGIPYDLELPFVSARGIRKWVRTIGQPVLAGGRVVSLRGAFMDVTERKEAESLARLQYEVTRILAESATIGEMAPRVLAGLCSQRGFACGELLLADRLSRRLFCQAIHTAPGQELDAFAEAGRARELALGIDLPGRVWVASAPIWIADLAQDATDSRSQAALAAGLRSVIAFPMVSPRRVVGVLLLYHREPLPVAPDLAASMSAIGTQVGHFVDRLELEEQFRQTQKMEALGTLAGGIAHDFNNILTAIVGNAGLLRLEVTGSPSARESVDAVLAASHRATDLVRQILAFSRLQDPERRVVSLQSLVGETARLLRASIPSTIEFRFALDAKAPAVLADPSQVHQVVMNLCTNAAHAMSGRTGRLEFVLARCDVDDDLASVHAGLHRGLHARLSVCDTGHGMDAATLARVFDPFFTTKAAGEGSGLGLAVVHGIMQAHGGAVAVYSQPGEGTRFDLYFPAAEPGHSSPSAQEMPAPLLRGRGEWILLVDDEEAISRLGKRALEGLGYRVEAFSEASRGLAAFAAAPDDFRLVITDLTMPVLTGLELTSRIHTIRPEVPVILTTGFSSTLTPDRARQMGVSMVLQKPIVLERLATAVHELLQGR